MPPFPFLRVVSAVGALAVICCAPAPEALLDKAVRAAAQELLAAPGTVGFTVGVVHDSQRGVWGFGAMAPDNRRRPDERTIYPIGSISKTFAGVLLAQAALDGTVGLSDDVRHYLDQQYPNLEFAGKPVPLFTLLNHRSGLPRTLPDSSEMNPAPGEDIGAWTMRVNRLTNAYSRDALLRDLHSVAIKAVPNTEFGYSNAAVQLLGVVLENGRRATVETLLDTGITRPLGLVDTRLLLSDEQLTRAVDGFEGGTVRTAGVAEGLQLAGAIRSTAHDMLGYVEWHLSERDESVRVSHQPTFTNGEYRVGLNWQMLVTSGGRLIWQDGIIPGFTALVAFQPERQVGLVVLSNSSDRQSGSRVAVLANRIFRSLDSAAVLLPVSTDP